MSDLFPPFVPDPDEPRRRFRPIPLRLLVPNVITLLALCLGLTAIRMAIEGRLELAMLSILLAAVLDGADGRVARLLKGTSRFGAELDSLSDFVNFGVAPALLLYVFILDEMKSLGWIAAIIYAIAAALRLARFNVMLDDPGRPEWQKNYFVGMAAPAGALTVLLPVYLHFIVWPVGELAAPVVAIYTVAIGLLMVSRIPTYSGKTLGQRIARDMVLPLFVVVVLLSALLVSFPFHVLALATIAYLVSLPFGAMRYRAREKAEKASLAARKSSPAAVDAAPAEDARDP
ncbi:CDP-diacylglycerol--serine O-phosphatidyltransferase [Pseudochelatococcus contaminans]|uniref:CDP-diacylglycerol--serine O-phosphatidyltransferase n=1 Tax=Pseudochelatococcus contaminans TaxID=1538103 RepID=A0A7W5Z1R1_9HYPH|nr:CDP-diacylglycerol--serine O-phosphatidyltransferase [Pseudochelatococcus contaminans]MBB3808393.1 CDP-diacylglycerol--serine O-phosphatidyltransferase [Pseudochelatococcus contaminans]